MQFTVEKLNFLKIITRPFKFSIIDRHVESIIGISLKRLFTGIYSMCYSKRIYIETIW